MLIVGLFIVSVSQDRYRFSLLLFNIGMISCILSFVFTINFSLEEVIFRMNLPLRDISSILRPYNFLDLKIGWTKL